MAPDPTQSDTNPRVMRPEFSTLFLADDAPLRRLPRAPNRHRPAAFLDRFEDRALYYDCFRHADGKRVLLVGPPPANLEPEFRAARFTCGDGGPARTAKFHIWRSTMITELSDVPSNAENIDIEIAGMAARLTIRPNLSGELAGRRILFSMNKDNDLRWIEEWARYHATMHATDTIILFDNGSTRYSIQALTDCLQQISGLRDIIVCDWPYRFGAIDTGVLMYRHYAHFLQISAMVSVLRRFGAGAAGLLNCDIDELAAPLATGTVYDLAENSRHGLAKLNGAWVSSAKDGNADAPDSHFTFQHTRRDGTQNVCPNKWALDPKRAWVDDLAVMPTWHRFHNAPDEITKQAPVARFWHFAGINSNWKTNRRKSKTPNLLTHRQDQALLATKLAYRNRLNSK